MTNTIYPFFVLVESSFFIYLLKGTSCQVYPCPSIVFHSCKTNGLINLVRIAMCDQFLDLFCKATTTGVWLFVVCPVVCLVCFLSGTEPTNLQNWRSHHRPLSVGMSPNTKRIIPVKSLNKFRKIRAPISSLSTRTFAILLTRTHRPRLQLLLSESHDQRTLL